MKHILFFLCTSCLMLGSSSLCAPCESVDKAPVESAWQQELKTVLPLLGHRNWILVVDKAFPLQSAAGMTYINTGAAHEEVIAALLPMLDQANHIRPILYTDKEFEFLASLGDKESAMVESMKGLMEGREVQSILHDDIFSKIDAASKLFNIVVIKTESTVAYSSLFIELDCGYWTAEKEARLRALLQGAE